MTSDADFFYRLHFKLRVHESSGDAFQRLVNDVVKAQFSDFASVRPWGNEGDGGNDGWIPSQKRYLQVYGPIASSDWNPVKAAKKARDDFQKLLREWPNCQHYSFVLNDRYDGTPAPVLKALQVINSTHAVETECLDARELTRIFASLPLVERDAIIGGRPVGPVLASVDPTKVGEVIRHLADQRSSPGRLELDAPDFEAKIELNGLADCVASELRFASFHIGLVDEFLTTEPGLAQDVAIEVRSLYRQSLAEIAGQDDDAPSVRFQWLMKRLLPDGARLHPHSEKAYDEAARVVLAKYFESCDLYEHPNGIES